MRLAHDSAGEAPLETKKIHHTAATSVVGAGRSRYVDNKAALLPVALQAEAALAAERQAAGHPQTVAELRASLAALEKDVAGLQQRAKANKVRRLTCCEGTARMTCNTRYGRLARSSRHSDTVAIVRRCCIDRCTQIWQSDVAYML